MLHIAIIKQDAHTHTHTYIHTYKYIHTFPFPFHCHGLTKWSQRGTGCSVWLSTDDDNADAEHADVDDCTHLWRLRPLRERNVRLQRSHCQTGGVSDGGVEAAVVHLCRVLPLCDRNVRLQFRHGHDDVDGVSSSDDTDWQWWLVRPPLLSNQRLHVGHFTDPFCWLTGLARSALHLCRAMSCFLRNSRLQTSHFREATGRSIRDCARVSTALQQAARHAPLSCATSFHDVTERSMWRRSAFMQSFHLFLGLWHGRDVGKDPNNKERGMRSCIRDTWPSHWTRRFMTLSAIISWSPHWRLTVRFDTRSWNSCFWLIPIIERRHWWWNDSSLARSLCRTVQHSDPYRRTERTVAL